MAAVVWFTKKCFCGEKVILHVKSIIGVNRADYQHNEESVIG